MAGSQISTSVSIIDSLSGFMALSLTEYNTSAAAAIAAGSKVEIAGAFFQFPADETPTGWTAITTGTTAYIALTASGTAGSQIVDASYTSTAPTWRDDLQGWYASAASSVRIVASVYKAEASSYYPKYVLAQYQQTNYLDKVKISSSLSVAEYPVSTFHETATAGTTVLPIGSIITVRTSGASVLLNTAISPLVVSTIDWYFASSYSATSGAVLSGSWVTRGATEVSGTFDIYLAQRIS